MKINRGALVIAILVGLGGACFALLMLAVAFSMGESMIVVKTPATEVWFSVMTNKIVVWAIVLMAGIGFGGSAYLGAIQRKKEQEKMARQVQGFKEDLNKERIKQGKEPIP